MPRILRRAVTAPRALTYLRTRPWRFFSSAKNAPARPHPLPCKCNYYRFERTHARPAGRARRAVYLSDATRDLLKTDFQLADVGRKVTHRMRRAQPLVRTRDVDTLGLALSQREYIRNKNIYMILNVCEIYDIPVNMMSKIGV